MKKQLFYLSSILLVTFLNAQNADTEKQKFQINIGTNLFENNLKNSYLGIDYKIDDEVSIGLNASWSDNLKNLYSGGFSERAAIFSFQTNMDWAKKIGLNTKKFDIYTGFHTGVPVVSATAYNTGEKILRSNFTIGGQFGLRYFITKNIGINAEINGGVISNNAIRAGLSFKF